MRLRRLFAVSGLLLGLASPASAYDRLYVFGDSLVDSGNARALSPSDVPAVGTATSAAYPSGRFTNGINGRNFADDLSRALGFGDATPYLNPFGAPGTNFAVGGATVGFSPTETRPDLLTEIKGAPLDQQGNPVPQPYPYNYQTAVAAGAVAPITANSLVLIADGGNDIRNFTAGTDPTAFVASVTTQLFTGLQTLYASGARNFVLMGVPDIGLLPGVYGTPISASATALSNALNQAYAGVASSFGAQLGSQGMFRLVDIASLQNAITANPAAYGITPGNEHASCYFDGGAAAVAADCQGYLYYDRIHPTAATHQQIAAAILAAIPEPSTWALMIVGFGFTGLAMRRERGRGEKAGATA